MSHPDPCFDPEHSYEDDEMNPNYDDHDDFYGDDLDADELIDQWDDADHYDDSMDGDHDSAMGSVGWAEDEYYNPSMDDYGDW